MGDGARLQQVLSNLVGNAIKFTEPGGRITVSLERGGRSVRVDVETPDRASRPSSPHLFERFRQADGSTSPARRARAGTGHREEHRQAPRGEVTAESAGPGRGRASRSCCRSRSGHRVAFRAPAVPDPRPESLRALDVLIVEDDNDSRHALALAVAELGATVRSVDSALLALQAYEARRPDVVISDIGMPGQDGYALVRAIRERETDGAHRTLAIAMTGLAGRQDRETALHAGFDEHVAKPVAVDAFLERVSVLAASLARQERRAH
jgi:CheY-like chemotaxis protein